MNSPREQFLVRCYVVQAQNPNWRWGQTIWRVALNNFPEKALNASETRIDPFEDNERVEDFLNYLFEEADGEG